MHEKRGHHPFDLTGLVDVSSFFPYSVKLIKKQDTWCCSSIIEYAL